MNTTHKLALVAFIFLNAIDLGAYSYAFINKSSYTVTINLQWYRQKRYFAWKHFSHRYKRATCHDEQAVRTLVVQPGQTRSLMTHCGLQQVAFAVDFKDMERINYLTIIQAGSSGSTIKQQQEFVTLPSYQGGIVAQSAKKEPVVKEYIADGMHDMTYTISSQERQLIIKKS